MEFAASRASCYYFSHLQLSYSSSDSRYQSLLASLLVNFAISRFTLHPTIHLRIYRTTSPDATSLLTEEISHASRHVKSLLTRFTSSAMTHSFCTIYSSFNSFQTLSFTSTSTTFIFGLAVLPLPVLVCTPFPSPKSFRHTSFSASS